VWGGGAAGGGIRGRGRRAHWRQGRLGGVDDGEGYGGGSSLEFQIVYMAG
jgi:hypothetical protein